MNPPKALFFDVNETLLDLGDLKASVSKALGGREDLLTLWFRMMLHYSLVETAAERYHNFGEIGTAALQMVARNQGLELSEAAAKESIMPIRSLTPHPDVLPALEHLKGKGYRMFTLTNSSLAGVEAQMEHAGLRDFFEETLSVESVRAFKPSPKVYHWAVKRVGLEASDCMMVAAHGWDVAGAMWAGMRAVFVARPGQQLYPLADDTEMVVEDLMEFARRMR